MTQTFVARDQLKAIIGRIEALEVEKAERASDIRDVYKEAEGNGFDPAILREVVRLRRKPASERAEHEALLDTYLVALGELPAERQGQTDA